MPTSACRQRRRIVDAVARHGDHAPLLPAAASRPRSCRPAAPPPRPRRCRACAATASAVVRLSPVSMTIRMPSRLQRRDRLGRDRLDRIGDGEQRRLRDRSTPTKITVAPSRAQFFGALASAAATSIPSSARKAWRCRARPACPRPCPARPGRSAESKSLSRRRAQGLVLLRAVDDGERQRVLAGPLRGWPPGAATSPLESRRPARSQSARACPRSACRSCRRPACRPVSMRSSASAFLISTPAARRGRRRP